MTDMTKEFVVAQLREEFVTFMKKMLQMPGSPLQKQQAFCRFDEGHMWMQNAVLSYVPTKPVPPAPVPDDQEQPQDEKVIEPEGQASIESPALSPGE